MAVGIKIRPQVQIGKELELVKQYVLLDITLQILNHDIEIVGASQVKIPRMYETMLLGLQDRVLLDMTGLRIRFRKLHIQLGEEVRGRDTLTRHYHYRGYSHSFSMPWSRVKIEAERLLKRYLSQ